MKREKCYTLYMHVCKDNGKAYVGLTTLSVIDRWKRHLVMSRVGSDLLFHRAIRKYGEEAWDHFTLDVVSNVESAKRLERLHIRLFETFAPEHPDLGYNLTRGGDGVFGCVGNVGKACSAEKKKKISEKMKGRTISDETKKKMRAAAKSRKRPLQKRTLSAEHRRKLSEAKRLRDERNHMSKLFISEQRNDQSGESQKEN